ncbi:hypothetical protein [Micromonospora echinofusca]|uniref:Lipoprotein n=1 Tax=Micromonospora echinofusca TaxID=47858 RepID=A0ABS3VU28_MICEH|nr:hypothetical protein [Micromonospora echinofusca]MBO4208028.1 hypothetical protein [Micromonospora echinofusca]
MPRITPRPLLDPRLVLVGALLGVVLPLTACGAPPELREPTSGALPATSAPPTVPTVPVPAPTAQTSTLPPVPTPADQNAGPCRTGPSADQVVRLLRRTDGLLPDGVRAKVAKGPLCADGWQYAVVEVTGHEALEMVSRGRADALRLVTAGTDVCTIEVRTLAPSGIRALACDAATGLGPGA